MIKPEFSRLVDVRQCQGQQLVLEANPQECADLARRIGLVRLDSLVAHAAIVREGQKVTAQANIIAAAVQSCAISGEDLPVNLDLQECLVFVPFADLPVTEEELEIDSAETDEIGYEGTRFDLGEAIAQSLALAIDPYATGPMAEVVRKQSGLLGEAPANPFAALLASAPKR